MKYFIIVGFGKYRELPEGSQWPENVKLWSSTEANNIDSQGVNREDVKAVLVNPLIGGPAVSRLQAFGGEKYFKVESLRRLLDELSIRRLNNYGRWAVELVLLPPQRTMLAPTTDKGRQVSEARPYHVPGHYRGKEY